MLRLKPVFCLILAGAFVFAAACSDDPEPPPDDGFHDWTLEDLTAADCFSLRTPVFEVASGAELQDCYFVETPDLNNGQPYWVDRIHTAINPGSHHMNVFRVVTSTVN